MSVDIKVNLDVDLEDGLAKIKGEIKSLEDDLDFDVKDIVNGELKLEDLFEDDSMDINDLIEGDLDTKLGLGGDDDDATLGLDDDRIISKLEDIRRGLGQGSVSRGRLPLNKTLSQRVVGSDDREKDRFDLPDITEIGIPDGMEIGSDRNNRVKQLIEDGVSSSDMFNQKRLLKFRKARANTDTDLSDIIPANRLSRLRKTGNQVPTNPGTISPFRADRYDFRTSNFDAQTLGNIFPQPPRNGDKGIAKQGIIDRELLDIINERRDLNFDELSNAKKAIGMSEFDNEPLLRFFEGFDAIDDKASGLRRTLAKVKPTMGRMYQVVALLLPAVGALAIQMASLGIAIGGLAAIGGGVALLGALGGEADTLQGSMSDLETQMGDFKKALFQAIQPAADQFAPLFNAVLESIVTNVGRVAQKMRAFDNMEGFLTAGIRGFADMMNGIANAFLDFKPQIKAVAAAIGSMIVLNTESFFKSLIKEGLTSFDTIIQVVNGLFMLGRVVFAILKNILNFVSVLAGLSGLLSFVADILGSKLFQALFIVGSVIAVTVGVLYALFVVFNLVMTSALAAGGILSGTFLSSLIATIPVLGTLIAQLTVMQKLLIGIAAIASGFTLGAVAFGALSSLAALDSQMPNNTLGSMSDSELAIDSGGGSTTINNDNTINVEGNPSESTLQSLKDVTQSQMNSVEATDGDFSGV